MDDKTNNIQMAFQLAKTGKPIPRKPPLDAKGKPVRDWHRENKFLIFEHSLKNHIAICPSPPKNTREDKK